MTNFDFLKSKRTFDSFADAAIAAERIFSIDPSACVLNCRRAMEFAVKWMYSVDKALVMPYQDTLVSLMNAEDFRDIVGTDIWRRMDFIRRMGNNAAHSGKKSPKNRPDYALKTCTFSLILWRIAMGKTILPGTLTALCWSSPPKPPQRSLTKKRTLTLPPLWQKTPH